MRQRTSEQSHTGGPWQINMDDRPGWQVLLDTIDQYIVAPSERVRIQSYSPAAAREQLAEVAQHLPVHILHYNTDGWESWGVRFQHRNFSITARFSPEHPYEPPLIFLSPAPRDRHYYIHHGETVARLCWCLPGEWHTNYRLIIAVGTALRFINDHHIGKTK